MLILQILDAIGSLFTTFTLFWMMYEYTHSKYELEIERANSICFQVEKSNSDYMTLKIINKSNGIFRDVFIICVFNKDAQYISKESMSNSVKDFQKLRISIEDGKYKYIDVLADSMEVNVPLCDRGMSKVPGIVLVYKDPVGKGWFKDTDNMLYRVKDPFKKLIAAGLDYPGYEQ